MGDHAAEGDDGVRRRRRCGLEGDGVNSVSIPIARRSGSSITTSTATRAIAILHSLGHGAVAGNGAGIAVGTVLALGL